MSPQQLELIVIAVIKTAKANKSDPVNDELTMDTAINEASIDANLTHELTMDDIVLCRNMIKQRFNN